MIEIDGTPDKDRLGETPSSGVEHSELVDQHREGAERERQRDRPVVAGHGDNGLRCLRISRGLGCVDVGGVNGFGEAVESVAALLEGFRGGVAAGGAESVARGDLVEPAAQLR
jgi:hypothetical protein